MTAPVGKLRPVLKQTPVKQQTKPICLIVLVLDLHFYKSSSFLDIFSLADCGQFNQMLEKTSLKQ